MILVGTTVGQAHGLLIGRRMIQSGVGQCGGVGAGQDALFVVRVMVGQDIPGGWMGEVLRTDGRSLEGIS